MMTQAVLHPEEIEGWRGVIKHGGVIKDHQTAIAEEEEQDQEFADEPEYSADAEDQDYEDEDDEEEGEDAREYVREGHDQ
jgi:hypothetical protein